MLFFVGLHHPSDAKHFERCMVSVAALRGRKSDFTVGDWIMDSGAFSEIKSHGRFRESVEQYAREVRRWAYCGNLLATVSQDYMCEPVALQATGLSVHEHQRMTIERYDSLLPLTVGTYLMPVLQGYWPEEYAGHVGQYGDRLAEGAWVGVGSVCKRNARVEEIEQVLMAISRERTDLRLHAFGLKTTALRSSVVRGCLHSSDSMAWSYAARRLGRDRNDWREAKAFADRIDGQEVRRRDFSFRMF